MLHLQKPFIFNGRCEGVAEQKDLNLCFFQCKQRVQIIDIAVQFNNEIDKPQVKTRRSRDRKKCQNLRIACPMSQIPVHGKKKSCKKSKMADEAEN